MNHGFWSALHTLGLNNNIWMKRWKAVSLVISTILVVAFIAVAVKAHIVANGCCACC